MQVFNVDLDGTLIYSYRHDIGEEKIAVETYKGREFSYITLKGLELLKKIREKCLVVPLTTRTEEQYGRIDLGIGGFKYVLACNGGVLLSEGRRDEDWYRESKKAAKESYSELLQAVSILEAEPERTFEVRFTEELFVFTKCKNSVQAVKKLRAELGSKSVEVLNKGEKVYVIPRALSKGEAVRRFKEYIGAERVIAAGDSELDISMAEAADIGIVPKGFCESYKVNGKLCQMSGREIYSDEMLGFVYKII